MLIEAEQRMIEGALEVVLVSRVFLIAIGGANLSVYIKNDLLGRSAQASPEPSFGQQESGVLGRSEAEVHQ